MRSNKIVVWALMWLFPVIVEGALVDVGPFTGDRSDDMTYGTGGRQSMDIFDGHVTISNLTPGGAIKIEMSSSLNGDQVLPRSSPTMMGQLGVMAWVFHTPISKIGGYFENNSNVDGVLFEFYDAQDQLLGAKVATVSADGQVWIWNGWESDVPISRIVSTGNDEAFLNGFIWYDDMEITQVPEPAGIVLALLAVSTLTVLLTVRRYSSRVHA